MKYLEIKEYDIANGPGVRMSLFVSGCTHHCKGCFNPESWDFNNGMEFNEDTTNKILESLSYDYIDGFSLLGGEPFEEENQECLTKLLRIIKDKYPDKSVWCYTGYLFDKDILDNMVNNFPYTKEMLNYIDIIVDGKFILEKKDLSIIFRGSSNQRIIDVQASLKNKKIILSEYDSIRLGGSKI